MAFVKSVFTKVATGFGLGSLLNKFIGGKDKNDTPVPPQLPTAPSPADSLVKAQQDADKRRRESLLSGGLINPTGGQGATLSPEQTQKKTLLGS